MDQRLSELSPPALDSVDSYIDDGRKWALIKLHGSVNWARQLMTSAGPEPNDPFRVKTLTRYALEAKLDDEVVLRTVDVEDPASLLPARVDTRVDTPNLYYPAISVPLGGDEATPSCPADHLVALERRLQEADGLHLLFLGYSGYDADVLRLVAESGKTYRSITIVDPDESVQERILAGLGSFPKARTRYLKALFSEFVRDHLDGVLRGFD